MPRIKVGLNEWIVVDKESGSLVLWTNKLIGCIGVTIITPERAFMTHLYSGVNDGEWNSGINNEFTKAIGYLGDLGEAECHITISNASVSRTPLYQAMIITLTDVWQKGKSKSNVRIDNSHSIVSVCYDPDSQNGTKFVCTSEVDTEKKLEWGTLMNSETGSDYIVAHGLFSHEASGSAQIVNDVSNSKPVTAEELDAELSEYFKENK